MAEHSGHAVFFLWCLIVAQQVLCHEYCFYTACLDGTLICKSDCLQEENNLNCGDNQRCLSFTVKGFRRRRVIPPLVVSLRDTKGLLPALLSLRNMGIKYFENDTFSEMGEYLTILDLSQNKLEVLHPALFDGLRRLTSINLSLNLFRLVPSETLKAVSQLTNLNLLGNQLILIDPDAFIGLHNLKILDISHNRLTGLPEESVHSMPTLQSLSLSYNNFTCDCNLTWLREFAQACLCVFMYDECSRPVAYTNDTLESFSSDGCPGSLPQSCPMLDCTFSSYSTENISKNPDRFIENVIEAYTESTESYKTDRSPGIPRYKTESTGEGRVETRHTGMILSSCFIGLVFVVSVAVAVYFRCRKAIQFNRKASQRRYLIGDGSMEPFTYLTTQTRESVSSPQIAEI